MANPRETYLEKLLQALTTKGDGSLLTLLQESVTGTTIVEPALTQNDTLPLLLDVLADTGIDQNPNIVLTAQPSDQNTPLPPPQNTHFESPLNTLQAVLPIARGGFDDGHPLSPGEIALGSFTELAQLEGFTRDQPGPETLPGALTLELPTTSTFINPLQQALATTTPQTQTTLDITVILQSITTDTGTPGDFITRDNDGLTLAGTMSRSLNSGEKLLYSTDGTNFQDITGNVTTTSFQLDAPQLTSTTTVHFKVEDTGGNHSPEATQAITIIPLVEQAIDLSEYGEASGDTHDYNFQGTNLTDLVGGNSASDYLLSDTTDFEIKDSDNNGVFELWLKAGVNINYEVIQSYNTTVSSSSEERSVRVNMTDVTNEDLPAGGDLNYQNQNLTNTESSFTGQNLAGADFKNALITNLNFQNAHIENATFLNATTDNTNFNGAHAEGTNFTGSDITAFFIIQSHMSFNAQTLDTNGSPLI